MKKTSRPAASRSASSAPAPIDNEPRPFTLVGRTALVTGSSKGLGKAIALALGQAGAKVALNFAHGQEAAEATFAEFTARGYEGLLVRADATNEKHVVKMCHAVANKLGPIEATNSGPSNGRFVENPTAKKRINRINRNVKKKPRIADLHGCLARGSSLLLRAFDANRS